MKISFYNYANAKSTEPLYLQRTLHQAGVESTVWADPQISAFDFFDTVKPDVFVTHYATLTTDIIKYLSNSNIDLVLNTTSATPSDMLSLEGMINETNIKCPLMFHNEIQPSAKATSKIKTEEILPACDVFFPQMPPSQRTIPVAIVSSEEGELLDDTIKQINSESYHLLSYGKEDDKFDMSVDLAALNKIYHLYDTIILVGDVNEVTSQVFFDMTLKSRRCSVRIKDEQQPIFNKFLSRIISEEPTENDDPAAIKNMITAQILRKHTAYNRAERLMKFLKNDEAVRNLQQIKNSLHGEQVQ